MTGTGIEWAVPPAGVEVLRPSTLRKNLHLVICWHAPEHRYPVPTDGREGCSVCKGDTHTTDGFRRGVQILVVIDPKLAPEAEQMGLF